MTIWISYHYITHIMNFHLQENPLKGLSHVENHNYLSLSNYVLYIWCNKVVYMLLLFFFSIGILLMNMY